MSGKYQTLRLVIGLAGVQMLLHVGMPDSLLALESQAIESQEAIESQYRLSPIVRDYPNPLYQAQANSDDLMDFEEDDALEPMDNGFNAIYVDNQGSVLGTFVYIPGAKLKVYASGQMVIEERDYTTRAEYYNNGRLREIGGVEFRYFNGGRIRSIGNVDFRYSNRGELTDVDNVHIKYANSGRVREIDGVRFEYERFGVIETISSVQTESGIRIVVVN